VVGATTTNPHGATSDVACVDAAHGGRAHGRVRLLLLLAGIKPSSTTKKWTHCMTGGTAADAAHATCTGVQGTAATEADVSKQYGQRVALEIALGRRLLLRLGRRRLLGSLGSGRLGKSSNPEGDSTRKRVTGSKRYGYPAETVTTRRSLARFTEP
jgi:hypothetical protein